MDITREQLENLSDEVIKEAFFVMFGVGIYSMEDSRDVIDSFVNTGKFLETKIKENEPVIDFNAFLMMNQLSLNVDYNPIRNASFVVNIDGYMIESKINPGSYDILESRGSSVETTIQFYINAIDSREICNPAINKTIQCPKFKPFSIVNR